MGKIQYLTDSIFIDLNEGRHCRPLILYDFYNFYYIFITKLPEEIINAS